MTWLRGGGLKLLTVFETIIHLSMKKRKIIADEHSLESLHGQNESVTFVTNDKVFITKSCDMCQFVKSFLVKA